ncbi:uncharacterized protein BYT42DRAFT_617459 [Radiomyces spectabilis]|uniref:uncharacterized protein n=1 Tax=Radiomyces spectabilis TaxID=64574 RepID=UPI00221FE675|nr:uncharacterized protein BYT42DRAFT_617459 [Radiomyces spectabilis]KAI8369435.1 hypothetical protein BYT42DRAFT_617459 [Radiomyces spectabilis]
MAMVRSCKAASWAMFHSTSHRRDTSETKRKPPNEYELRIGHAITTLQDDLPQFFASGLTEHTIYANDIVLTDPHYTRISVHGRTAYLGIAQMLRWSLRLYFDDIQLEIVRMRVLPESHDPDDFSDNDDGSKTMMIKHTHKLLPIADSNRLTYSPLSDIDKQASSHVRYLQVRWRLEGVRRSSLGLGRILGLNAMGAVRHVEGVFLYTFDNQGYIGEHRIQRILPPPSRRILLLHSIGGRIRAYWEALKRRREPTLSPLV